jgi:predicted Zn-dependent peptidase
MTVTSTSAPATAKKHLRGLTRKSWPGRPQLTRQARLKRQKPMATLTKGSVPVRKGFWWVKRESEQVHLVWGVAAPPYASKDRFAAFLLNIYLGGGMSSALFQEIREKNGLAYTVYSSLTPYVDSGLFQIYAATGTKQVALCLKLIEECVNKLKRDLLSESELEMIKNNFKGSVLLASDDVESRMSSIAKNEMIFGRYVSVDEVCRQIEAVTPADIRRMARKLLASDSRSIVAVGPAPTREVVKKYKPTKLKR